MDYFAFQSWIKPFVFIWFLKLREMNYGGFVQHLLETKF